MPPTEIRIPTTGSGDPEYIHAPSGLANIPAGAAVASVASVARDQLYYWSHAWQAGELESLADFQRGDVEGFDSAQDAIRWLFSIDG